MLSAGITGLAGAASTFASSVGTAANGAAQASDAGFSGLVRDSVQQTSGMEAKAQSAVMDLLGGGGTEVHSAMIQTQQSELAFELALQVRNKAVSAYQQMMQMQF